MSGDRINPRAGEVPSYSFNEMEKSKKVNQSHVFFSFHCWFLFLNFGSSNNLIYSYIWKNGSFTYCLFKPRSNKRFLGFNTHPQKIVLWFIMWSIPRARWWCLQAFFENFPAQSCSSVLLKMELLSFKAWRWMYSSQMTSSKHSDEKYYLNVSFSFLPG